MVAQKWAEQSEEERKQWGARAEAVCSSSVQVCVCVCVCVCVYMYLILHWCAHCLFVCLYFKVTFL